MKYNLILAFSVLGMCFATWNLVNPSKEKYILASPDTNVRVEIYGSLNFCKEILEKSKSRHPNATCLAQ